VCVWVSGASLDSLSPGPQHRHRGRLRHVSLPPRRSQAELSHVSAKRALTLNRDVEAESIQRRVAASTRRAWSDIATQHRGCIAASPRTARGRRSRWALGPGGGGCARGRSLPADGRRAGRRAGLVSRVFTVIRRSAARRVVILFYLLTWLTARAGAGGMLRKNVSTYIGVPRRGPGQGQGNTHTGVPRGRRSIRKDVR